jgi:hypothetical protein
MKCLPNKNVVATFCFRNKFDVGLSNNMKRYNHGSCNAYTKSRLRLGAHWQLLVAQLFSCPDGEHCFIRERAHWQLFYCGNRKLLAAEA